MTLFWPKNDFFQTHSEAPWLKNTVVVVTGEAAPLLIHPLIYGTPTTDTSPRTRAKNSQGLDIPYLKQGPTSPLGHVRRCARRADQPKQPLAAPQA